MEVPGGVDPGVRDPACLRALAVFGHPGAGVTELCSSVTWERSPWPGRGWTGPGYEWVWADVQAT